MDFGLRVLKGKVFGDWLVTGPQRRYKLQGHNLWHNKEGFFLVRNGIVYNFVPYENVLEKFGRDMRPMQLERDNRASTNSTSIFPTFSKISFSQHIGHTITNTLNFLASMYSMFQCGILCPIILRTETKIVCEDQKLQVLCSKGVVYDSKLTQTSKT